MVKVKGPRRTDYDVIVTPKKRCKDCEEILDESEYGIAHVFTRKADGLRVACLHSRCKKCQSKHLNKRWMSSEGRKDYEERLRNIDPTKKVCKRCKQNFDRSEYKTSHKTFCKRDGTITEYLRPYCKKCQEILHHERWLKNKERLSSPKKLKENREHRRRRYFRYRAIRFRQAYDCMEKTSKELAWIFWQLWHKQRGRCAITGYKLTKENAQIDHIEPRVNGINNNMDNLQWTTNDANRAKNQMTEEGFDQFVIDIYNHRNLKPKNV